MNRNQSFYFHGYITIFFFIFLNFLPNTFASPTWSLCRHDQRDALLELKKEFLIPTESWNTTVDCCSWPGVTCDAIFGQVISLQLIDITTSRNVSLKSSSGLFKLQHLRLLDLSNCNLYGKIPSSIGYLSNLTYLLLSLNHLVGEIPASIGNLNKLQYLYLWSNDLIGNIPTSFSNLTKLSALNLGRNQFTGGENVLANLTSLSDIDISTNHFKSSIFPYLSVLPNLERLLAYENSFSGHFPSSLLMISSLAYLDLSENQLEGSIDFGNTSFSSNLGWIDVSYNYFDGLIPTSISKFRNLESLDLSCNYFRGQVPRSISKLVNLSSIDLSYNKLEGQVPHFLWRMSKLEYVQFSHNSFTTFGESVKDIHRSVIHDLFLDSNSIQGSVPEWICKFKYLEVLVLSDNHFSSIPQCLKHSTSLRVLNLRNNSLNGFLQDLCINGTKLRSLDVSHNNLAGKLPKSLINCKDMDFLNVAHNKIKDMFPFWLGYLKSLRILVLRSNVFHGQVFDPSAYLGFRSMKIIDISNNNFVGSLPQNYFAKWSEMSSVWSNDKGIPFSQYMGDIVLQRYFMGYKDSIDLMYKGVDTNFDRILKSFKAIDFSGNRFSGQIPESICLLKELRLLNLSGNAFIGNIPSNLANITNLETLDLSRNNLSGKIPQSLGKLSFLSNINFSHNHLEGPVPRSTQFQRQNCSSFVDNLGLYGLEKICGQIHAPFPTSQQPDESLLEEDEPMLNWIVAAIAYVPGVFCGLVLGHIFTSYKHKWFTCR